MKTLHTRIFLTIIIIIILQAFVVTAKAYSIKLDIQNLPDQEIFLCRYHGNENIRIDSTLSRNGCAEFKGSGIMRQGIYFISNDKKKLFDFPAATSKKTFLISASYNPTSESIEINDSKLKEFNEAQNIIDQYIAQLSEKLNFYQTTNDKAKTKHEIDSLNNLYIDFLLDQRDRQKRNNFIYRLYNMAYVAETDNGMLMDAFDFSDASLLNTPEYSFQRLLDRYMLEYIDKIADNLNKAYENAEKIVEMSAPQSEYREYILNNLISFYQSPDDLRLEAIFCHLFNKYYHEKPEWLSDYNYSLLNWKYSVTKSNVIGLKGKDIVLPDANGKDHSLYGMKSKYKLLVFWDSECEICIEKVSRILADYPQLKDHGADVFAVYTEAEYDQWEKFVSENELPWINVSDPETVSTYDYDYGTYLSPRLFLLDENNIIIAKDFDASEIIEVINKSNTNN